MSHNGFNLRIEQAKGFITGLLVGGAVGAGTALLNAPNSGKKTRRKIHKQAAEVQNRAEETVEGVRTRVQTAGQQVMEQGKAARERLQE